MKFNFLVELNVMECDFLIDILKNQSLYQKKFKDKIFVENLVEKLASHLKEKEDKELLQKYATNIDFEKLLLDAKKDIEKLQKEVEALKNKEKIFVTTADVEKFKELWVNGEKFKYEEGEYKKDE